MASIFSKIIQDELPAYRIAEDDTALAFLDINPLHRGHTLVVPKQEVDYLFDLDEDTYQHLWSFSRHVARAMDRAITCERIGVAVVGLEVPHAHIHLIPINGVQDIDFSRPKLDLKDEEFLDIQQNIWQHLS